MIEVEVAQTRGSITLPKVMWRMVEQATEIDKMFKAIREAINCKVVGILEIVGKIVIPMLLGPIICQGLSDTVRRSSSCAETPSEKGVKR